MLVLFVHSLSYGVFFEDPLVWAILGIACASLGTSPTPLPRPEPHRARRPRRPGSGRPVRQAASMRAANDDRPGLDQNDLWLLLAALALVVLVAVPTLGAEPWAFRPDRFEPIGPFARLVDAIDGAWDVEAVRAPGLLAGLLVALAAAAVPLRARWPRWSAIALTVTVVCLLAAPAVLLQAGLRQSTEPWFHTNDSTYQIELAGGLLRNGDNPYGHDFSRSGLERFYSLDGTVNERDAGGASRSPALRVLSRHGADGGRLDASAGAVVGLPLLRPSHDARRQSRLPWRSPGRSLGDWPAGRSSRQAHLPSTLRGSEPRTHRASC